MTPDPLLLLLSRLQFGFTASFHYLFVPLTVGLALAMALMDTAGVFRRRPALIQAASFWNRFFVLAWLMGFATGYPLRLQLADRWTAYSEQTRAVLHALMGMEGWLAPGMLLLVAVLALGSRHLPPGLRVACRWLLAASMLAQSVCIVTMNAWMQHPVGTHWHGSDGAELVALAEVFMNPTALHKVSHTLSAALLTGALFIVAVSAFYLLRQRHLPMASGSLAAALPLAGVSLGLVIITGHGSARDVMAHQPMKFAALEAHWNQGDGPAPMVLFGLPDMAAERNDAALEVPYLMSWLATHSNASPRGMKELVDTAARRISWARQADMAAEPSAQGWRQLYQRTAELTPGWAAMTEPQRTRQAALASRPHVPTLFFGFRVMVGCGLLLAAVLAWAAWRWRAAVSGQERRILTALCLCVPLPWVATLAGWMVAEVGRQPWVVYEQMTTAAAVVLPPAGQTVGQLVFWGVLYAVMALGFGWMVRWLILRGPERRVLPRAHWSAARDTQQAVSRAFMATSCSVFDA